MYEGQPFGLTLPDRLTLEIVETDPYLKGATVTGTCAHLVVIYVQRPALQS